MSDKKTEDEATFGAGVWVYCKSHVNPHTTGWCTVPASDKVRLDATTAATAVDECKRKGFKLFRQ